MNNNPWTYGEATDVVVDGEVARRDTVTKAITCEKTRANYTDSLQQIPEICTEVASDELLKASRGWFENFKKRIGIHLLVKRGEAASACMKADEDYIKPFAGIIAAEG